MGLAVGVNLTAFSLLNAVVFRHLPVPAAGELVSISMTDRQANRPGYFYLEPFEAFQREQRSFASLSLYSSSLLRIEIDGLASDVSGEGVMPAFFGIAGIDLSLGRALSDADDTGMEGVPGVVISSRLWRRMFHDDPGIVGRTMTIESHPVRIVGVAGDRHAGLSPDVATDVWLPISVARKITLDPTGPVRAPYVVGRLADGVPLSQARAEVLARWPVIQQSTPTAIPESARASAQAQSLAVEPLARGFSVARTQYGSSFLGLGGLAALLLCIAGVNLVGLSTVRALGARREAATKLALGAGGGRILREWLTDGVVLSIASLGVAIPLAWWACLEVAQALSYARALPSATSMTPDLPVLVIGSALTIVLGIAIGLVSALCVLRGQNEGPLRQERGISATWSRAVRLGLVAQVTLSMVLVVGAGLFAQTLFSIDANQAGLRGRSILFTRLTRNPGDRTVLDRAYFLRLTERLASLPGVRAVGLSNMFPGALGFRGTLPTETFSTSGGPGGREVPAVTDLASPGLFEVFGIGMRRGRDFAWHDDGQAPGVVILSESLAARLFPGEDAVGKVVWQVRGSSTVSAEVVGVVADAPFVGNRERQPAVAFRPVLQELARAQMPLVHLQANGDPAELRDLLQRVVDAEGHRFVRDVLTLDGWLDFALLQERLIVWAAAGAAILALLVAGIGVYASLAYSVTARLPEFAVRMALGASPAAVLRMVTSDGLRVVAAGIALGIPCALAAAMLVRSQLYGVSWADPVFVSSAAVLFLLLGIVASMIPAWRAAAVDPARTLREGA